MKRMVDDKEIREFDDRITALEQGGSGGTTYTSGEFIYVDNQEKTISLDYTNSGTIEFDTSEGRLWPKVIFGDGLNADNTGLYVDNSIARTNDTLIKNADGNIDETIYVSQLSSDQGEDTDNKGKIYLGSGVRTGSVRLEAGGEESSASILVRGTSAVGSEGLIELRGESTFYTDNRINVINSSNTEELAYLSDITNYTAGSNITFTANGSGGYDINSTVAATISSLSNYAITITYDGTVSCSYKYVFKDVPNYDTTPTDISAIRLIPNYAPMVDTTNNKIGFLKQGNTWVSIYWSDGTTTHVDFTSSPTANIV